MQCITYEAFIHYSEIKKTKPMKLRMNQLTLGQRIGLGFGLVLCVASVLGGIAIYNMQRAAHSAQGMVSALENKFI
ncbi:MAG TPA: hypothetical protein VF607_05605, partial [Verrucomicrobiae bacterium]